jgi:'Cold-shock' DNA-binding domain
MRRHNHLRHEKERPWVVTTCSNHGREPRNPLIRLTPPCTKSQKSSPNCSSWVSIRRQARLRQAQRADRAGTKRPSSHGGSFGRHECRRLAASIRATVQRPSCDRPGRPDPEIEGTVKWFNPDKGFGFVVCEDGGKDVFLSSIAKPRRNFSLASQLGQPHGGARGRDETSDYGRAHAQRGEKGGAEAEP